MLTYVSRDGHSMNDESTNKSGHDSCARYRQGQAAPAPFHEPCQRTSEKSSAVPAGSDNGCSVDFGAVTSPDTLLRGQRTETRRVCTVAELAQAGPPRCAVCGRVVRRSVIHQNIHHHFCSRQHYYLFRRGGRDYRENRSGQRYARKVVAEYTAVPAGAVVHHHDRNNLNNRPENLALFASQSDHMAYHHGDASVSPLWDGREAFGHRSSKVA